MGSVIGTAANGVGTFLGNAFAAPFRSLFGVSCEAVCSGTWDVACFLEHLCMSSLARLFMVLVLSYIMLLLAYLMCKVGIIQCVVKKGCKMSAAACSGCCHVLGASSCFLWRKLRDTKRVHRGRRRRRPPDIEEAGRRAGSSSEEEDSDDDADDGGRSVRRRSRAREGSSSVRERRKDRLRRALSLRKMAPKKEHAITVRGHGIGAGRHHRRVAPGSVEPSSTALRVHGSHRPSRR
ncbi:hypothetical protein BRADI_1g28720v3 [Brachypodium distachyon]|uniref:Uncharacterized protein n=1 Tax=Brachypodium distachyon TaxID=15368 RepID=I1GUS7_BRADI|nr:hypothetical protein BRADI_1g28720v3 [Brachypodium distachyon]